MNYLIITEDGELFLSESVGEDEYAAVKDGILDIFSIIEGTQFIGDGVWIKPQKWGLSE